MYIDDTSIGLDSTKGEIGCFCSIAFGQGIEEGGFTDIGESDDSEVHSGNNRIFTVSEFVVL